MINVYLCRSERINQNAGGVLSALAFWQLKSEGQESELSAAADRRGENG
jgi:hypothetical protein